MLSDIVDVLADPIDGTRLAGAEDFTRLVSESGHSYDVAKQGYVTPVSYTHLTLPTKRIV